MDISTNIGNSVFNFRVCALIIHDNKLLCHKCDKDVYYATPGGRVMTGEPSEHAIIREMKEELNKEIISEGLLAIIENFFTANGKPYHEILFAYKCEFEDEQDKSITETLKCIEPGKNVNYEWIDLNDLQHTDIRPAVIKEVLSKKDFPVHIVNCD